MPACGALTRSRGARVSRSGGTRRFEGWHRSSPLQAGVAGRGASGLPHRSATLPRVVGNEIGFNGGDGVRVDPSIATIALGWNRFSSNGGLGIDLGGDGVTVNDPGDGDTGVNGLLNMNWQLDDQLSVEVRTELRRSELRTEDGWGAFLRALLRYRFRQTSVDFSLLSSREEWDISSDRDVLRAMLTVTRRF